MHEWTMLLVYGFKINSTFIPGPNYFELLVWDDEYEIIALGRTLEEAWTNLRLDISHRERQKIKKC